MLIVESYYNNTSIRILNYSSAQYMAAFLPGLLHNGTTYFLAIAMQNERPGFISLLGYIGLVYAFVGDMFVFKETI